MQTGVGLETAGYVIVSRVGQPLMLRKTSYFDQTCNEFISDWVVIACLGPKPIKVLFKD